MTAFEQRIATAEANLGRHRTAPCVEIVDELAQDGVALLPLPGSAPSQLFAPRQMHVEPLVPERLQDAGQLPEYALRRVSVQRSANARDDLARLQLVAFRPQSQGAHLPGRFVGCTEICGAKADQVPLDILRFGGLREL